MSDTPQDTSAEDTTDAVGAKDYATNELTNYCVDMLEYYSDSLGRSQALGVVIEALSESLGNMISLVKEGHQDQVISDVHAVINQGMINQTKLVAEMQYGAVGHA